MFVPVSEYFIFGNEDVTKIAYLKGNQIKDFLEKFNPEQAELIKEIMEENSENEKRLFNGFPDYWHENLKEFIEIKSGNDSLKNNQIRVFQKLNKLFKIRIILVKTKIASIGTTQILKEQYFGATKVESIIEKIKAIKRNFYDTPPNFLLKDIPLENRVEPVSYDRKALILKTNYVFEKIFNFDSNDNFVMDIIDCQNSPALLIRKIKKHKFIRDEDD